MLMLLMLNAFAQGTKLSKILTEISRSNQRSSSKTLRKKNVLSREIPFPFFVECNQPLGMESGKIKDESISATDSHAASSSPHHARLNSKSGAGAWCHPSIDRTTRNEYLQVNLYLI